MIIQNYRPYRNFDLNAFLSARENPNKTSIPKSLRGYKKKTNFFCWLREKNLNICLTSRLTLYSNVENLQFLILSFCLFCYQMKAGSKGVSWDKNTFLESIEKLILLIV
jgi:hypothetical protein